jgi:hypothetical protein
VDARIDASAVRAARQDAADSRSMPQAVTIEFPRNGSTTWTLRPLFEVTVSGWFPALVAKPSISFADSATNPVLCGGSGRPMPSGRRLLHGQATIGSRRKIRNKWTLCRFPEAIVAGWCLPKSSKFPGNSSKRRRTRKKFADGDPFRGEKPGKTPILGVQNRPKMRPFGVKTVGKGAKDWVLLPRWRRLLGIQMPLQKGPK